MKRMIALMLVAIPASATAEVVGASGSGFEVRQTIPLVVKPEVALGDYAGDIGAKHI